MRRWVAAFAAAFVMLPVSALAQTVDETPGEQLGGYDALGSSLAFSFQPYLPSVVSTGDVPFEGTVALGSSRVRSGGNAFGRASLVWPGATAADLGPVLGVAFGQEQLGALIPKWPIQAEATQDSGEVVTGQPPAISMRAVGHKDRSTGDVRIADVHIPRLLHIENIVSTSSSVVTDSSVTAVSRVALNGVTLIAGHIKIEQIRSVSLASSIGGAASSSGDVDVIGMKIGGVNVSVTDDGFQVDGLPPDAQDLPGGGGEPAPGTSPEDIVNEILNALGVRITLFNSISRVSDGQAERMQPGMVISVENPLAGQGPIPPGQRFDIFLASTSASALGSLPFGADLGGDLGGGDLGVGDGGDGDGSGGGGSFSLGDGPEVAGESVSNVGDELSDAAGGSLGDIPQSLGDLEQQSDRYSFAGLPLGMVFGLLLLAALVSRYVRNFFRSMMLAGTAQEENR